jgi:anti-anti-sigma factor
MELSDMTEDERIKFNNKIFFCDIVGYSKLTVNDQFNAQSALSQILRSSLARLEADCVALPTGDGVILNFVTGEPHVHVDFALDALKGFHECGSTLGLRIGLNSNVDTLVRDINGNRNVVGNGINVAQRIMDLGGHGQILMHDRVREDLKNHPDHSGRIRPIGEFRVKHGQRIPVAQFVDPGLDYVSSNILAPQSTQTGPVLDLADVLRSRVQEEVLSLHLDHRGLDFLPEIADYVEEFLEQSPEFQSLRYSVAWIVAEMMDNALRHGQLPEGEHILLKLGRTAGGMRISVTQPDTPGLVFDAVLTNPRHRDSFLQILNSAGLKPRHWREGGRLEVTIEVPLKAKRGSLADFAHATQAPIPVDSTKSGASQGVELVTVTVGENVPIYRPEYRRIDLDNWEDFLRGLRGHLGQVGTGEDFNVDIASVEYMSSAGLRSLMICFREAKAREVTFNLIHPTALVREILAISRFDTIFRVIDNAQRR